MDDPTVRRLEQLLDAQARIAGDLVEVGRGIWAIHGLIPVEGEVILAEFGLADDARAVLDKLGPNDA